jgi:tetratricopeptide (TPR) repeat protein
MGVLFLICSADSLFSQIDPAQLIDRSRSRPPTVSRNQLLAPGKALRAIERARKDVISGHLESAQKEITRALDIAPHYAAAKAMQGGIDLETGNYDEAANSFQEAMDDDPALGGAYVGMAVALIHQQRFQAALPLLDRAEGLLPGAWFVHFAKAWAQLELGNTEAALKQADFAERMAGGDPEKRSGVFYLRAMVSIHINDTDGASEYLAQAVACGRGGEYAVLATRELERIQPLLAANR